MVHIRAENLGLTYQVRQKFTLAWKGRKSIPPADRRIEIRGNDKFVQALKGVSFSLNEGDRLGLIGSNGSGKTTLLKLLHGIFQPTEGQVVSSGRIDALYNINLGFRSEATGRRNIELRGLVNGWSPSQIAEKMDEIIDFSDLGDFIDLPYKSYSQGMAARLAFSIATTLDPQILLMDEWIGAGDKNFQSKANTRMTEISQRAGIIILASHNQNLIERTCNKILRLEAGVADPVKNLELKEKAE